MPNLVSAWILPGDCINDHAVSNVTTAMTRPRFAHKVGRKLVLSAGGVLSPSVSGRSGVDPCAG